MYKAKIAETEAEVSAAYELFYRSFGPTYYESKQAFDITRENDPTMKKVENLFVVEDGGKSVVAALRTVVRDLVIFGEKFQMGGIPTTVVHPEHQDKGLFNLLTRFALNEMINRGLSLSMVFARRAIDYIYVPHGFWGTPVERRYTLLDPPELETDSLNFRRMELDDSSFLEKAYRQVYQHLSVFLDRPEALWKVKMKLPSFSKQFDAYICTLKGANEPIGYVVAQRDKGIIDICSCDEEPETYKSILFSKDSPVRDAALIGLNLSTEHPAIKAFRGHAYSIYTRHPHYGGNVLKILEPYNQESRIMQLVQSQLANRGAKISNMANLPPHIFSRVLTAALFGYEIPETRTVLEISEESQWNILKPVDFIFSPLDDF